MNGIKSILHRITALIPRYDIETNRWKQQEPSASDGKKKEGEPRQGRSKLDSAR